MNKPLLDILKRSGDGHVGHTLVRLARLAEAAHRFETAQQIANDEIDLPADGSRSDGPDRMTVVAIPQPAVSREHAGRPTGQGSLEAAALVGSVHKEVAR